MQDKNGGSSHLLRSGLSRKISVISKAKCLSKEDVIAFMVSQLIDEDNGIWDKHAYKELMGYTDIIQIAEEFPDLDRMGRKLDIYNYKHLPPA